jgi:hypothetical protein
MNEGSGMHGLGYLPDLTRWWKLELVDNCPRVTWTANSICAIRILSRSGEICSMWMTDFPASVQSANN